MNHSVAVLLNVVALGACSVFEPAKPAVSAINDACESGLVDAALVLAKAQSEKITPQQAAEIVCAAAGVADAYYEAQKSGAREGAEQAAIRQAQKVGAL